MPPRPSGAQPQYHVRYLKRFPIGTKYPDIVNEVEKFTKRPDIQPNLLVIDGTGVGRAVTDLFHQRQSHFIPVQITGGNRVTKSGGYVNVPKRDLVSTVKVLLQTDRLKIAEGLPEAELLVEEMLNFQVKISTAGHDTYGAGREGTHDDLVLSVCLACWAGEKKLLPKGLRNPRPSNGRKGLYR